MAAITRITTAAQAEAAECPAEARDGRREIPDDKVRGLYLRVDVKARKAWVLRYRNAAGASRRLTLGDFPSLSLAKARQKAEAMRAAIADGADPTEDAREARRAAAATRAVTVADLVKEYLSAAERGRHRDKARPLRGSTLTGARWHFEQHIKQSELGALAISAVRRGDLQKLINRLDDEGRTGSARAVRNLVRAAFNYGIREELAERNPATMTAVKAPGTKERTLTDDEIRALWAITEIGSAAFADAGIAPATAIALRLSLATGQRIGEVTGIHAREIDPEAREWTLPAARAKNHRAHKIPLSPLALDLTEQAFALAGNRDGFAFPSQHDAAKPMLRSSLTGAMRRLCVSLKIADPRPTPHDLRRTAATRMGGLGISRFVVGRVLNHTTETGGGAAVTGGYDLHDYLAEKRRALEAWADTLTAIVSGEQRAANVRQLRA